MDNIKFDFENLKVFQKVIDFVDFAYDLSSKFPQQELYGLASPLHSASVSIALNIASGAGDVNAQCNRFLQISI